MSLPDPTKPVRDRPNRKMPIAVAIEVFRPAQVNLMPTRGWGGGGRWSLHTHDTRSR
jgi:hypothetical protein